MSNESVQDKLETLALGKNGETFQIGGKDGDSFEL